MKNKFLNICIGISLVLFGSGFFLRSLSNANAAPSPQNFIEGNANQIGKYMMQVYITAAGTRCAIVWDTETGKSKNYYYNDRDWLPETSLPQKPVGE